MLVPAVSRQEEPEGDVEDRFRWRPVVTQPTRSASKAVFAFPVIQTAVSGGNVRRQTASSPHRGKRALRWVRVYARGWVRTIRTGSPEPLTRASATLPIIHLDKPDRA